MDSSTEARLRALEQVMGIEHSSGFILGTGFYFSPSWVVE